MVKNRGFEVPFFCYLTSKEICLSLYMVEGNRFMYTLKEIRCHMGVLNRKYQ